MSRTLSERYMDRLASIPPPGGNGCHPALLAVANLGVLAGLEPARIHADIRRAVPSGRRRLPDSEIQDAIHRALRDHGRQAEYRPIPSMRPKVKDGSGTLRRIIGQARITNEVDLWEASLIRLHDASETDAALFLGTMFRPDDLLFIGDRHDPGIVGDTIRTTAEWIHHFAHGGTGGPFVVVNPLTGGSAPKKSGEGVTLRGDACIAAYRHVLAEFDALDYESQIRFWSAVKLPVKALVHSAGKSVHAWLDVQSLGTVQTREDWDRAIKQRLFRGMLEPVGADSTTAHPARLARLPGHFRADRKAYQRILWLSAEARAIC